MHGGSPKKASPKKGSPKKYSPSTKPMHDLDEMFGSYKVLAKSPKKASPKKASPKKSPSKKYITGNRDTDIVVLSKMQPTTFWKTCQTNSTIRKLCMSTPGLSDKYFKLRVLALVLGFLKTYKFRNGKTTSAKFIPEGYWDDVYRPGAFVDSEKKGDKKQGLKGIVSRRIGIDKRLQWRIYDEDAFARDNFPRALKKFLKKNKIAGKVFERDEGDGEVSIDIIFEKDWPSMIKLEQEIGRRNREWAADN